MVLQACLTVLSENGGIKMDLYWSMIVNMQVLCINWMITTYCIIAQPSLLQQISVHAKNIIHSHLQFFIHHYTLESKGMVHSGTVCGLFITEKFRSATTCIKHDNGYLLGLVEFNVCVLHKTWSYNQYPIYNTVQYSNPLGSGLRQALCKHEPEMLSKGATLLHNANPHSANEIITSVTTGMGILEKKSYTLLLYHLVFNNDEPCWRPRLMCGHSSE
jgi:hypothetical protein